MSVRKRRLIFIGASQAGKTTLTQAILREELRYRKTQSLNIAGGFIIDTPGEYLEMGSMRGALSVVSTEADLVVFIESAVAAQNFFPPAFASMFVKPIVGVISKADRASLEDIEKAKNRLMRAGAKDIFVTSGYTGVGILEFIAFVDSREKEEVG